GEPRTMLVLGGAHELKLADHMLQKQQRPVIHARQAGAEAAGEAKLFVLPLDLLLLPLPIHSERRVSQKIVESLAIELILGETVAKANVVAAAIMVHLFHEHVRS